MILLCLVLNSVRLLWIHRMITKDWTHQWEEGSDYIASCNLLVFFGLELIERF